MGQVHELLGIESHYFKTQRLKPRVRYICSIPYQRQLVRTRIQSTFIILEAHWGLPWLQACNFILLRLKEANKPISKSLKNHTDK